MDQDNLKDFITGALVIDKPVGMTSHDVVKIVRNGTGIRRVGHTGTLDPRASGVLVVLIGPAVRLSEFLSASDKRYQASLRFGVATDTYDTEGKQVGETKSVDHIKEEDFQQLLKEYEGKIEQVPPAYSAVKVNGEKSYNLARKGEAVELKARMIDVYTLELLEWDPPEAVIDVYASSGTYVRSLANDLGNDFLESEFQRNPDPKGGLEG
jgi:tRNA pseudouridine55 synthase